MIDALKNIFGKAVDYKEIMKADGIIIDVRSPQEYSSGHIEESINIPLDKLDAQLSKLKDKNQPIITCCASGMRSGSAKSILISKGYEQVYNGGGWMSLNGKI